MAIKFSGINIISKNAYAAYEFYKGLGFKVTEVGDDPSEQWWCVSFDINGSTLWIWKDQSGETATSMQKTMEIVVGCGGLDSMNTLYKDLTEKDYEISKPEQQFYGGWEMQLTDLDGNKILFLD